MFVNDILYRTFLEEMHALENFRMTYTSMHPSPPLEQEDPEIKRLIEAMAFYIARTHISVERNILATRRRIFQQFFSFLLNPLPSMGMFQAKISRQFAETKFLPKYSEVAVTAGKVHRAIYRTTLDLNLYPIYFTRMETLPSATSGGNRLILHFQTPYPRQDEIGNLSFYINHLNNYSASLQVFFNLQKYLKKISIYFNESPVESPGIPCPFSFGSPVKEGESAREEFSHPLQRIRNFFHFPMTELYLNLQVPVPPRNWTNLSIAFELDKAWPKSLKLNQDVFQLFTVPIANLKRTYAQPVICDGSSERYPILYPDKSAVFNFHSSCGVYRVVKGGMIPLRPGILTGGPGSYEVEHTDYMPHGEESFLLVNIPQSVVDVVPLAVDGLWYQPWFNEHLSLPMEGRLYDRHIEGIEWDLVGDLCPANENPLKYELEGLLQFLALQKKSYLSLNEILLLLKSLGSFEKSPFKEIPSFFTKLDVSQVPHPTNPHRMRLLYEFGMNDFGPAYVPLVETFLKFLSRLLNAWTSEGEVFIRAEVPESGIKMEI